MDTVITNPSEFWWEALTSPLSARLAALWVMAAAAGVVTTIMLVRIGRQQRRRRAALWADNDGTATVEFALLLPILLFTVLTLTQVTFLMGGNLFVHYAAFAACRSAIVQIPLDYVDDPPNAIANVPGAAKYDAVYRTAVYALLPVAGQSRDSTGLPTSGITGGLTRFYSSYGQEPPEWIARRVAQRVNYAAANTEVTIERPEVVNAETVRFEPCSWFGPKDPVTVRVDHRLSLNIPYISQIFADGEHSGGAGRYMNTMARATLTNEGHLDTMPPPPDLPRRP